MLNHVSLKMLLFSWVFFGLSAHPAYFQLRSSSTASVWDAEVIFLGDLHESVENIERGFITPEQRARNAHAREFIQSLDPNSSYLILMEGTSGPLPPGAGSELIPTLFPPVQLYGWDMKNLNNVSYLFYSSFEAVDDDLRAALLWEIQLIGFVRSYFMAKKILALRSQFPNKKIIVLAGSLHIVDSVGEELLRREGIKFASLVSPATPVGGGLRRQLETHLRTKGMTEAQVLSYFLRVDRTADQFIKQAPSIPGWQASSDDALYLQHCEDCWCHLRSLGKTQYVP